MKPVFARSARMIDEGATCSAHEGLARLHMVRYFAGKRLPDGRPIPLSRLLTRENIESVLGTEEGDFVERMDRVYRELGTFGTRQPQGRGPVPWDVQVVLDCIKECTVLRVPLPLVAGIVLVYVRLCKPTRGLRLAD